jgi:hypothetical protein
MPKPSVAGLARLIGFPDEPVALYAGGAASFVARGGERRTAARDQIKRRIQDGEIRLVCATDAACEGLNLQRLGAQVNVDMPWNPSRLEQRKGRVQRIGQGPERAVDRQHTPKGAGWDMPKPSVAGLARLIGWRLYLFGYSACDLAPHPRQKAVSLP